VRLEEQVQQLQREVAERDKRIAALEEESICLICWEANISTVLLECGHAVLCTGIHHLEYYLTCGVCSA
jgi:hypothetical protein